MPACPHALCTRAAAMQAAARGQSRCSGGRMSATAFSERSGRPAALACRSDYLMAVRMPRLSTARLIVLWRQVPPRRHRAAGAFLRA